MSRILNEEGTFDNYYGFQTVCKCPFCASLVTLVTDCNQTWRNYV